MMTRPISAFSRGLTAGYSRWSATVPVLILALALLSANVSNGSVFFITNGQDTTSAGSLRGAILAANGRGGNNTIVLNPGIYWLRITGSNEDKSLTGDLDITAGNLTVFGAGSGVVINATSLGDRVFQVFSSASLTLVNLVITGGTASPNLAWADSVDQIVAGGAAILAQYHGAGGAIYNLGMLRATGCIFTANASDGGPFGPGGDGGAIYNDGTAILNHCIIYTNAAHDGGGPAHIWLRGNGGNGGG